MTASVSIGSGAAAHREFPSVRFYRFSRHPTPPHPGWPHQPQPRPGSPPPGTRLRPSGLVWSPASPPPCRSEIAPLWAILEHSENLGIQFSQVFGGAPVEPISGYGSELGSGSVRENSGYGFRNRLSVFGFCIASTQIRGKFPGGSFGYSSGDGKGVRENCCVSWTFRGSSLYFQSSALPTELPGLRVRKRVLNSCTRSKSSPPAAFARF